MYINLVFAYKHIHGKGTRGRGYWSSIPIISTSLLLSTCSLDKFSAKYSLVQYSEIYLPYCRHGVKGRDIFVLVRRWPSISRSIHGLSILGVPLTKDPAAVALEEISLCFRPISWSIVIKGMPCFVGLNWSFNKTASRLANNSIIPSSKLILCSR